MAKTVMQHQPKISLIVTTLNEEKTILQLLSAVSEQTRRPNECIVADGGSLDQTQRMILQFSQAHPELKIQLIQKKGNRSVGRNAAIQAAHNEWIAITDAGCVPHRNWLEELSKKIAYSQGVIAGYYDALPKTSFEEAVIPYVLVMPDKITENHFLPATRSMLIKKNLWERFGRFNEQLNDNEDYAFSRKISDAQIPIPFAKNAMVTWIPRQNLRQFFWMVYRFARGDVYSGILRPKVGLIFGRYIALLIVTLWIWQHSLVAAVVFLVLGFFVYAVWSIKKNLRYVPHGWYWLPILQIVSDKAVMMGSVAGVFQRASQI